MKWIILNWFSFVCAVFFCNFLLFFFFCLFVFDSTRDYIDQISGIQIFQNWLYTKQKQRKKSFRYLMLLSWERRKKNSLFLLIGPDYVVCIFVMRNKSVIRCWTQDISSWGWNFGWSIQELTIWKRWKIKWNWNNAQYSWSHFQFLSCRWMSRWLSRWIHYVT